MPIHVVPVVDGRLLDLTLDGHVNGAREALGFNPIGPVIIKLPGITQHMVMTFEEWEGDLSYVRRFGDTRHIGTPYWREFFLQGGREMVGELLKLWRRK